MRRVHWILVCVVIDNVSNAVSIFHWSKEVKSSQKNCEVRYPIPSPFPSKKNPNLNQSLHHHTLPSPHPTFKKKKKQNTLGWTSCSLNFVTSLYIDGYFVKWEKRLRVEQQNPLTTSTHPYLSNWNDSDISAQCSPVVWYWLKWRATSAHWPGYGQHYPTYPTTTSTQPYLLS